MAPSVGVNRPVVMPPISSTGVMMGSTAWNLNFQSAANSATMTPKTTGCAGRPAFSTSTHASSGQPRRPPPFDHRACRSACR
jgi:hypothetical protein